MKTPYTPNSEQLEVGTMTIKVFIVGTQGFAIVHKAITVSTIRNITQREAIAIKEEHVLQVTELGMPSFTYCYDWQAARICLE